MNKRFYIVTFVVLLGALGLAYAFFGSDDSAQQQPTPVAAPSDQGIKL